MIMFKLVNLLFLSAIATARRRLDGLSPMAPKPAFCAASDIANGEGDAEYLAAESGRPGDCEKDAGETKFRFCNPVALGDGEVNPRELAREGDNPRELALEGDNPRELALEGDKPRELPREGEGKPTKDPRGDGVPRVKLPRGEGEPKPPKLARGDGEDNVTPFVRGEGEAKDMLPNGRALTGSTLPPPLP